MRISLLLIFLSTAPALFAEDQAGFSADRPGTTPSAEVIPGGAVQFELGTGFRSQREDGIVEHTITGGAPLLRLGAGHRTELRFGGDGFRVQNTEASAVTERIRGWSDFAIGAKIKLLDEHGWRPAFAILPALSLPLGHDRYTSNGLDPAISISAAKSLPYGLSAGLAAGFASISDNMGRIAQRSASVSLGHALAAGLSGYVEIYGVSPEERGMPTVTMADAGVSHAAGKHAQVDIEAGRRFFGGVSCWFVSGGLAFRNSPPHWLRP